MGREVSVCSLLPQGKLNPSFYIHHQLISLIALFKVKYKIENFSTLEFISKSALISCKKWQEI